MIFFGFIFLSVSIGLMAFQLFYDITDDLYLYPLFEYLTVAFIFLSIAAFVLYGLSKRNKIGKKLSIAVILIAFVSATVPSVATGISDYNKSFSLSYKDLSSVEDGINIINQHFYLFSTDDGTNVCYTDCSVITTVDDDGHNYSYHYYKTLNPVYRLAALIQLNPASEYGYIPGFNPPVSMNSYKEEGKMILMFTDGNSVQVIVMSLKGIFVIDFYNTSADDDALVSFKNKAMEQFDLLESIKESEMKKICIEVYN